MKFLLLLVTSIVGLRVNVAQKENLDALIFEGSTTQQCKCVPYYMCAKDTRVKDEGPRKRRESDCPQYLDTCCSPEDILDDRSPSAVPVTSPVPPPQCKCVPYYQCSKSRGGEDKGITEKTKRRETKCPQYLDTCCNPGDILEDRSTSPLPVRSTAPPPQCECVPYFRCKSYGGGDFSFTKIQDTGCPVYYEVCCNPGEIVGNVTTDDTTSSSQQTTPITPTTTTQTTPITPTTTTQTTPITPTTTTQTTPTITQCPRDAEKACCRLPPPQQNGKFSPSKRRCPPDNTNPYCQMTPGNIVPHKWTLFHSCDSGYVLNDTNLASVCLDGQWRPPLPSCGQCGISTRLENNRVNTSTAFGMYKVRSPREYPWVAAIYYNASNSYSIQCVGTLVSTRYVLTAARLVTNLKLENIRVSLGKTDIQFYEAKGSSIVSEIDKVLIHEMYNFDKNEMDVALLRLRKDVHVTASIMPVCLNSKRAYTLAPGTIISITGWTMFDNLDTPQWNDFYHNYKLTIAENTDCFPSLTGQRNFKGRFCVTDWDKNLDPNLGIHILQIMTGSVSTFQEEGRHFLKGMYSSLVFTDLTFEPIFTWIKKNLG